MATPEQIAAAWGAWRVRHKGSMGPGPGFVEAINAALAASPVDARLRETASAVIEQWDTPNWNLEQSTAVLIENLRTALRDGGGK